MTSPATHSRTRRSWAGGLINLSTLALLPAWGGGTAAAMGGGSSSGGSSVTTVSNVRVSDARNSPAVIGFTLAGQPGGDLSSALDGYALELPRPSKIPQALGATWTSHPLDDPVAALPTSLDDPVAALPTSAGTTASVLVHPDETPNDGTKGLRALEPGSGVVSVLSAALPDSAAGLATGPDDLRLLALVGAQGRALLRLTARDADASVMEHDGGKRILSGLAGQPVPLGGPGTTDGPFDVAAADLDGDGDLDLVSGNGNSANLTVFHGSHEP